MNINQFKKFISQIREKIINLIETDINDALALAEQYGEFLWDNYVGIYSDYELEEKFVNKLEILLDTNCQCINGENNVAHVVTALYERGGHTRLLINLVQCGVGDAVISRTKVPEIVKSELSNTTIIDDLSYINNLDFITSLLEVLKPYKTIILHIHPSDIITACACAILYKHSHKILFYNHADHAFSYGMKFSNKILEISNYGWLLGKDKNISDKQSFCGIPFNIEKIATQVKKTSTNQKLILVSGGSFWKYCPINSYSFVDFLNRFSEVISKPFTCVIIGTSGEELFWTDLSVKAKDNVSFVGALNYNMYKETLSSADIYVDSFPLPNGTAFTEALLMGLPVFGLSNLSGCSVADGLRSNTVDLLIKRLLNFIQSPDTLLDEFSHAIKLVVKYQSQDAVAKSVINTIKDQPNNIIPESFTILPTEAYFLEKYWKGVGKFIFHSETSTKLTFRSRIFIIYYAGTLLPLFLEKSVIRYLELFLMLILGKRYMGFKKYSNRLKRIFKNITCQVKARLRFLLL